jgi:GT2 family glycosyltransferase/2-polyprenyl-3-methyl-5-hydroxy-6-metoxy-1,4-benzoquinol methylase
LDNPRPSYEYHFDPDAKNNTAATVYRIARGGGRRILDLGSGPAIVSSYLKRVDNRNVTCIDGAEDRLAVAASRGVDRVILADLDSSDWAASVAGETFDVIILADVLEHLKDPRLVLRSIRERSLLAPDGFLVVSIPNIAQEAVVADLLSGRFLYRDAGLLDETHIRFFTLDSIVELIDGEGFFIAALERTIIPLEKTELHKPGEALPAATRASLSAMPEARTYQFVFRAQLATDGRRSRVSPPADAGARAQRAALAAKRDVARLEAKNRELERKLASVYASRTWKTARVIARIGRVLRPRRALRRPRAERAKPVSEGRSQAPPARSRRPDASPRAVPQKVDAAADGAPTVSVVIPAFNRLDMTKRCVTSIFEAAGSVAFEVVVVDNGSSDGTSDWLRAESRNRNDLVAVVNDSNLGFAGGVNRGARAARGRVIVICNNDVVVTDGWLDRLTVVLDAHSDVAIVSPVTNHVGEDVQRDGESTSATADVAPEHGRRAAARGAPPVFVPDRLVFFCVAVRADVFEMLGGLSEDFGLGNFEDDDFCTRAQMLGMRLAVDPNVFVYHEGNATWASEEIPHAEWMKRNRVIYLDKLSRYALSPPTRRGRRAGTAVVSVILRTDGHPPALRDALTSLANQVFKEFEVVVVDGGENPARSVIDEFADTLSITYRRSDGRPFGPKMLNEGLSAARGRWIAYLDDRDIFYPMHLGVLAGAAERSDEHAFYADSAVALWRGVGAASTTVVARRPVPAFAFREADLLVEPRIPTRSLIHSIRCVDEVGAFDEEIAVLADWNFALGLARRHRLVRVVRITSEQRVGLGGALDRAVLERGDVIKEAQRIYERFTTTDPEVESRRRSFLESQHALADEVQAILATADEEQAAALALSRVAGLRAPDRQVRAE